MKQVLCIVLASITLILVGCSEVTPNLDKKEYAESFWVENQELLASATEEAFALLQHSNEGEIVLRLSSDNLVRAEGLMIETESPSLEKIMFLTERPVWIREKSVEFGLPGAGFGPNTFYCGLIYLPSDDINDFPYFLPDLVFTINESSALGTAEDTDNRVYIERIDECIFYYEMYF